MVEVVCVAIACGTALVIFYSKKGDEYERGYIDGREEREPFGGCESCGCENSFTITCEEEVPTIGC